MRGFLRRGNEREFAVELTVHRLNNIPVTHRMMFIHWRLSRRDSGTPHYGFTDARPVEAGNCVTWEARVEFTAKISSDPSDPEGKTLTKTPLELQLRSEKKARFRIGVPSYNPEGKVELDLAEVAVAGSLNRHILVQDSLLNATLHVSVRMRYISGGNNFRVRDANNINSNSIGVNNEYNSLNMNSGMNTVNNNGNHSPTTVQPSPAMSNSSLMTAKSHAASASNLNLPTRGTSMISQYSARGTFGPSGTLDTHTLPSPPSSSTPNMAFATVGANGNSNNNNNGSISRSSSTQRLQSQPNLHYAASSTRSGDQLGTDAEDENFNTNTNYAYNNNSNFNYYYGDDDDYYYVPDPHIVQWPVYEKMFYGRMRDTWPDYVVHSRQDPNDIVDQIFETICAEDDIRLPGSAIPNGNINNNEIHTRDNNSLGREPSTTGSESSRRK